MTVCRWSARGGRAAWAGETMESRILIIFAVAAALGATGCGRQISPEAAAAGAAPDLACWWVPFLLPVQLPLPANPLANNAAVAMQEGRTLFGELYYCSGCHGGHGRAAWNPKLCAIRFGSMAAARCTFSVR